MKKDRIQRYNSHFDCFVHYTKPSRTYPLYPSGGPILYCSKTFFCGIGGGGDYTSNPPNFIVEILRSMIGPCKLERPSLR